MKKLDYILAGILVCCLVIIGIMFTQIGQNTPNPSDNLPTTNVTSIFKNPMQYLDKQLTLTGVVAISIPGEHMFLLTDPVKCGTGCGSKCSNYMIPVSFTGEIPNTNNIVQISGSLVRDKQDKVVFSASTVTLQ